MWALVQGIGIKKYLKLFKIIYYTNLKGEITFKQELLNVVKIDKYLTIPEECDYTKSPK